MKVRLILSKFNRAFSESLRAGYISDFNGKSINIIIREFPNEQ